MIRRHVAALLASAILTATACREHRAAGASPAVGRQQLPRDSAPGRAPDGVRIKVEVINASKNRGLARRVAFYLRDRGFDVVFTGSSRRLQDPTVVLDRSGHPEWAALVASALRAKSESRPDTTHYIDATVLLGSSWTPPPMPFYP